MAGSRLHKIGTIFTRTTGLIKSGALKPADKPIWYDVYEAFPPKIEPRYDRPEPSNEIRNILYEEDQIRAKFYEKYGSSGIINLHETSSRPSICELFIQEYLRIKSENKGLSEEVMMEEIAVHLQSKGIYLRGKEASPKENKEISNGNVNSFRLSEIMEQEYEKLKP